MSIRLSIMIQLMVIKGHLVLVYKDQVKIFDFLKLKMLTKCKCP